MGSTGRITLSLRAGGEGEDAFLVSRVEGHERLCEPYAFEVEVSPASLMPLDLDAVVGHEAALRLRRTSGEERWVHGDCARAELTRVADGVPLYRLTLAPRLRRLSEVAGCRIFQEKSVPEVVQQVLGEHGIEHRAMLAHSHPAREYLVQYRESDLAFVSRLLESEGIWYRFEHREDGHELVLADGPSGLAGGGAALPIRDPQAQDDSEEHVFHCETSHQLVVDKATRRDFDFARPDLDLTARSGGGGLEVYEYPGGYGDPADGRRLAKLRLAELRHGAETMGGKTTALSMAAGARVEIEGHGELAIVAAEHHAEQQRAPGTGELVGTYQNAFAAIPASRPYLPRRRTRRPAIAGVQTAVVVGQPGEEIHTDAHGRIKVQLPWDREGRHDDQASCWVRLSQQWAGLAMGASFVPRIGQEVVIRFLEGDPDRPLVVGAVYNGANPPPLGLPEEKTRSTLRTDSTPGGAGENELRFEDDATREEIHLHAQRDERVKVRHDRTETVRADAHLAVLGDRSEQVLGERRADVRGDERRTVGVAETLAVAGDRDVAVQGSHSENVGVAQAVHVSAIRNVKVGAASLVNIGDDAGIDVTGSMLLHVTRVAAETVANESSSQVDGNLSSEVGRDVRERIELDRKSDVGDLDESKIDGAVWSSVDGDADESYGGEAFVSAGPAVYWLAQAHDIQADQLLLEVAGKPVLMIDKQGNVKLYAANATLDGSGIELKGGTLKKIEPESVQDQQSWVEIELVDENGDPVPDEKFELHLANGDIQNGQLDGSGKARVEGLPPGSCSVVFPDFAPKK